MNCVKKLNTFIKVQNNHTFTKLRDTLLPKLMSGELRVNMD